MKTWRAVNNALHCVTACFIFFKVIVKIKVFSGANYILKTKIHIIKNISS